MKHLPFIEPADGAVRCRGGRFQRHVGAAPVPKSDLPVFRVLLVLRRVEHGVCGKHQVVGGLYTYIKRHLAGKGGKVFRPHIQRGLFGTVRRCANARVHLHGEGGRLPRVKALRQAGSVQRKICRIRARKAGRKARDGHAAGVLHLNLIFRIFFGIALRQLDGQRIRRKPGRSRAALDAELVQAAGRGGARVAARAHQLHIIGAQGRWRAGKGRKAVPAACFYKIAQGIICAFGKRFAAQRGCKPQLYGLAGVFHRFGRLDLGQRNGACRFDGKREIIRGDCFILINRGFTPRQYGNNGVSARGRRRAGKLFKIFRVVRHAAPGIGDLQKSDVIIRAFAKHRAPCRGDGEIRTVHRGALLIHGRAGDGGAVQDILLRNDLETGFCLTGVGPRAANDEGNGDAFVLFPGERGSNGRGLAHIAICIIPNRVIFALRKHKAVQRHLQVFHLYRLSGVYIIFLARDLRRRKVVGRANRKTCGCRACILTITREYRIIDAHISGGLIQRGAIGCGKAEGEIFIFFQPDGAGWRIHPDAALLKLHRLARVGKAVRNKQDVMGVGEVFPVKDKKAKLFCFAGIGIYACQHHVVFAHIGRRAGKGRAACRFVRNRIIFAFDKLCRRDLRLYGASGVWVVHTVLQVQSVPIVLLRVCEAHGGRTEHGARSAAFVARGGRRTAVILRGGRRTAAVARGGCRTTVMARGGCRTAVVTRGGRRTAVVARGGRRTAVIARGGRRTAVVARSGRRTAVVARSGRRTAVVARGEHNAAVIARGKAARALRRRGRRQHAHTQAQAQQCRDSTLFHIRSPLLFRPPASFPGKGGPSRENGPRPISGERPARAHSAALCRHIFCYKPVYHKAKNFSITHFEEKRACTARRAFAQKSMYRH